MLTPLSFTHFFVFTFLYYYRRSSHLQKTTLRVRGVDATLDGRASWSHRTFRREREGRRGPRTHKTRGAAETARSHIALRSVPQAQRERCGVRVRVIEVGGPAPPGRGPAAARGARARAPGAGNPSPFISLFKVVGM